MWQLWLFDAYPTLIDGEHICLLKVSISKNRMKQNDEDLSELELKSFWYKLHKQSILSQNGFNYIFLNS